MAETQKKPKVGLFATCLVDYFRPSVGFATVELLEAAGCDVIVPPDQTCCGQPAYNNGLRKDATDLAKQVLDAFWPCDYIVAPSGSCAAMIREHYPRLLGDDPVYGEKVRTLCPLTYEVTSFLTDVLEWSDIKAGFAETITFHDSCSGLRELGIKAQPRQLLSKVDGLTLSELSSPEVCCGFGGTFCMKNPEISADMVAKKVKDIEATGAETVCAGDLGCLLNIAGYLKRQGSSVKVRHVTEVLTGRGNIPAIGEGKE